MASGRWPTFCLACSDSTRDSNLFRLDWERLHTLQKPPLHQFLDPGDIELSQSSHQDIADKLQAVHASVAGSASRIELQDLERMIMASQKAADSLDLEMAKSLYMSAGFGAHGVVSHRRYKSLFILKVLLASIALKLSPRQSETTRNKDTQSFRETNNNKNTTKNKNKNKTKDTQGRRQKNREAKDDVDDGEQRRSAISICLSMSMTRSRRQYKR